MSDGIDRLIDERRQLDAGLGHSLFGSVVGHLFLAGAVVTSGWWVPQKPIIHVVDGFQVPLPPGGGGPSKVEPAAGPPATAPAATTPPAPAPAPPPKVIKPPKEDSKARLPELDSTKKAPKNKATPAPARAAGPPAPSRDPKAASTGAGGTGKATDQQFPGLDIMGPAGPGVPGGTDLSGDWYLAGVQRKIWMLWNQQIKPGFVQPIGVSFTILADGSVTDVRVIQPSGISQLDFAAQRAVMAAAPFSPLPKDYGTNRFTIQALFKPTT